MIIESGGRTIDSETGEVVEDSFVDLDTMEQRLFLSLGNELDSKLAQIRALLVIHDRRLYQQRLDDNGVAYSSFQTYLKSIEPKMAEIGAGKFRSLLAWIVKHKVFVGQLGYPETVLRQLGAHLDVLLPAAARHQSTSLLLDHDEPTENGKRLGKEAFRELVQEIEGHVLEQDPRVPETSWQVSDTKERVDEVLGRDTLKSRIDISAHWSGDKIKIDHLSWWLNDYNYQVSDLWDFQHFKKAFGSATVSGLGDEWKG